MTAVRKATCLWPECRFKRFCRDWFIHTTVFKVRVSDAILIVFSDACGGQDCNINIACLWMYVVSSSECKYSVVDHKLMISGHLYLPNKDFGSIENTSHRTQLVFVPEDWCTLVGPTIHLDKSLYR